MPSKPYNKNFGNRVFSPNAKGKNNTNSKCDYG